MAPVFPLAKLGYLLIKQVGKPFAKRIKERAKNSHFFRSFICMPPAQFYHWIDVNIKMRMMNLGKPVEVPKLNEAMAIELGAELLGEGVVFGVAAACLIAEYIRSSRKEREKEVARQLRTEDLENRIYELEYIVSEQEARIREMNRFIYKKHRHTPIPMLTAVVSSTPCKQHLPTVEIHTEGLIEAAIDDVIASISSPL